MAVSDLFPTFKQEHVRVFIFGFGSVVCTLDLISYLHVVVWRLARPFLLVLVTRVYNNTMV